ncbi:MAG: MmgE/PrpD family protein [bacterium]
MTGHYDIRPLTRWISTKETLSVQERTEVRRCLLDTLACLGVGWSTPVSLRAGHALEFHRHGMISLAMRFGTAMHALDFDDSEIPGSTHPSAVILAALLPLADQLDATIDQLTVAYITGFETIAWFGRTCGYRHYEAGWHATATTGLYGAVAACARLLELTDTEVGNGLSMASSYAGGLKRQFGSDGKSLHVGMTAANALMIVPLIKAGHSLSEDVWNGPEGYMALHHASQPDSDFANAQLGKVSALEKEGVVRKAYPSCHYTHRLIEAALTLRPKVNLHEIECIVLEMPAGYATVVAGTEPMSGNEARFSVTYCVASTLVDGGIDRSSFEPDRICRKDVQSLMKVISLRSYVVDDLQDLSPNAPDRIQLIMKDGKELIHESSIVPGSPDQPLTDAQLVQKSLSCLDPVLNREKIQHLINLTLEDGVKIRELTSLVRQFRTSTCAG